MCIGGTWDASQGVLGAYLSNSRQSSLVSSIAIAVVISSGVEGLSSSAALPEGLHMGLVVIWSPSRALVDPRCAK